MARYSFGPLSTRGAFAGLRLGQLAFLAGGFIAAAMVFALSPNGVGLLVALGLVGTTLLAAFVAPGGRGVDQWAPVLVRSILTPARHLDPMPTRGIRPDRPPQPSPPPPVRGVSFITAEAASGGHIAIMKDRRAGTWTAVLSCQGGPFPLLGEADKTARLNGWGRVLADVARPGSPVHRLQWLERTMPDDGDALQRDLVERRAVPDGHAAARSYDTLLRDAQPVTQEHEALLAVTISGRRAVGSIRRAGGGDDGAAAVVLRELEQLAGALGHIGVRVLGVLPLTGLAKVVRTTFDPSTRWMLAQRYGRPGGGLPPEQMWPLATQSSWRWYRTDGAVHATYWVAEWPRVDAGPDLLEPLLLTTRAIRSVSVVMEPRNPVKAQREVEHALTDRDANDAVRARYGFAAKFRHALEREAEERRREELAVGHGEYRFAGYVTVSVTNDDELDAACAEVEQRAQQSGLDLQRLYGQQDEAFTFILPLGRGLR